MTNFKIGNWAVCPEDNKIFLIDGDYNGGYQSTEYWSGLNFILWKPKPDEWCWFWSKSFPKPQLLPFRSYFKNSFYSTEYGVTIFNEVLCECNYFDYCEPFIGQLPTILKDK